MYIYKYISFQKKNKFIGYSILTITFSESSVLVRGILLGSVLVRWITSTSLILRLILEHFFGPYNVLSSFLKRLIRKRHHTTDYCININPGISLKKMIHLLPFKKKVKKIQTINDFFIIHVTMLELQYLKGMKHWIPLLELEDTSLYSWH